MSKRTTVLKIGGGVTRQDRMQQLQSKLVRWAELMVRLQELEEHIQTLKRDGVLQDRCDDDAVLHQLDELREVVIDSVPTE